MGFSCENVSKVYETRNGAVEALKNINIRVEDREFVCVVGPSGCGKSTLIRIISGLVEPSAGRIVFDDAVSEERLRCAMVFQEHGLFPWMTVLDNVAFGLEAEGLSRRQRRQRARVLVEQMGLARFTESYPHELSVGMRQRVGIARAFLTDPEMLLMDEPFGSLDAQTKQVLQEELLRIWREHSRSVFYITHDIEEAVILGDRILVMSGTPGCIREEISVAIPRPRDPSNKTQYNEIAEIRWHIWNILGEEVQKNLLVQN